MLFVLILSVTGIALNHSSAWQLDRSYVHWSWLLDAYGIEAPPPSASFAAGDHRVTLLGERLYFDGLELARNIDALTGAVATSQFLVIATNSEILILTTSGELVERISLAADLPAKIEAVGMVEDRVVVKSGNADFRFDEALVELEPWPDSGNTDARWATPSPLASDELATLQNLYRGRGLTVERLLTDTHSGRIFTRLGPYLMDAVAVILILLSLTGLLMWLQRTGS